MRIVVLGDFHLCSNRQLSVQAMEDVRNCRPDLVVPLGDFGTGAHIGSPSGLEEAYELLKEIGAPLRPILGNHDLQRESGPERQPHGTMESAFRQLYGLEASYGVIEYEHFRLVFASTEAQPEESCRQVQECYVSEEQFLQLVRILNCRRGVPVIMFTHAPPIGCGLRTVPDTHVRATNAYLDQNYDPARWLHLVRSYPEIVMWFSAHYHLSHHYPDAHTFRYGTHFFITGVHGSCTRDGRRQSRIIDVTDNQFAVGTLDHDERSVIHDADLRFPHPLAVLMQSKMFRRLEACPIGQLSVKRNSLVAMPGGRFAAASEDMFVWEACPAWEAVLGSLHVGVNVRDLVSSKDGIWSIWDNCIGISPYWAAERFVRVKSGGVPAIHERWDAPIQHIAAKSEGGVWAVSDGSLWSIRVNEADRKDRCMESRKLCNMDEPTAQLISDGFRCWIIARSGRLYRWDGLRLECINMSCRILTLCAKDGRAAAVVEDEGLLKIAWIEEDGSIRYENWPMEGLERLPLDNDADVRLICLGNGHHRHVILLLQGRLYYWAGAGCPAIRLDIEGTVASLSGVCPDDSLSMENGRFAFTTIADGEIRSRLEVWELANVNTSEQDCISNAGARSAASEGYLE